MKWFKLIAICFILFEVGALVYVNDVQAKKIEYELSIVESWTKSYKYPLIGHSASTDIELLEFTFARKHIGHKLQISIELENCILEGVYTLGYANRKGYDVVKYGSVNMITFEPINRDYILLVAVTPMGRNHDIPIFSGTLNVIIELQPVS